MGRGSARAVTARRVESALRQQIADGRWGVGDLMPSRRVLAAEFGVALGTLQDAVAGLLAEGVLTADDRRGTFVAALPEPLAGAERVARSVRLGVLALYGETLGTAEGNWGYWVVKALEREAARQGAVLSLAPDGRPAHSVVQVLDQGAQCLAVVVMKHSCPEPMLLEALAVATGRGVPVAMVTDRRGRYPVTTLRSDEWHGGYLAAQHLLANGYRRVAFLAAHNDSWVAERAAGVVAAVEQLSEGQGARLLQTGSRSYEAFLALDDERQRSLVDGLLADCDSSVVDPLGLVCATDHEAGLVLAAVGQRGWAMGSAVGLVGFDGSPVSRQLGLTSLRQPIEELGEAAARTVLRAVAGEPMPTALPLTYHLVARASTQR